MASGDKESRRSHWEDFWEEKREIEEVYSNADRIIRNLSRVLELKGKRVLEIGAGSGRDSFPLAEAGADVVQLDYAENSLRILKTVARQRGLQTSIIAGDTFQLPFRTNTFDVVFHQGLLEHFRKPQAENLLRENIRVLKPGGHLLVDVPQRYHVYTLAKHMLMALNKWFAGWERSFSAAELSSDLRRLGLTPVLSYGEWMYPSFFYRVMREVAKKSGVNFPLAPTIIPQLSRLRASLRSTLRTTVIPLYTGISIGIIARKPSGTP